MTVPYTYYYQGAFRGYIEQFLRIFSGLQVEHGVDRDEDGNPDRETCSVYYGDMSRIVANVLRENDTFRSSRLPLLAGSVTAIEPNPEERRSRFHQENITRVRESDNKKVVNQKIMGVPFRVSADLSIYTSNNTQMFQLLEQILLLFNPKLTIQKSDSLIDWNYLTDVELVSITSEQNVPPGMEERIIIHTLSFTFDVWLDFPGKEKDNLIEQIELNVKDSTVDSSGVNIDELVIT